MKVKRKRGCTIDLDGRETGMLWHILKCNDYLPSYCNERDLDSGELRKFKDRLFNCVDKMTGGRSLREGV